MQEIYQLKKKIKVLEEEILIGSDRAISACKDQSHYDRDKILLLYEDGLSDDEIEQLSGLQSSKRLTIF
ncbi:hypothetical protein KHA80_03395 [Anaerobacillus sp. HL2]|nr:hypothetical protein KHA80_03395 [Anaerobacillus sp. HL2]